MSGNRNSGTKGYTNNPDGRPKGSQNKITKDLRKLITGFLEDNIEEVLKVWKKANDKDKLNFFKDLLKYSVPVLQSIEMKSDFDKMTDAQLDKILNELKKIQNN